MEQLSFANSQAFCNPILHRYASSSSPKSSRVHHDHQLTTLIFSRLDYIPRHMTDLRTVHRQSQPTTLHPKPRQLIKPNKSQSAQGVQDKQLGWNPLQKMAAKALDMVEMGLIEKLERQRPLPRTADPAVQLAGNFFPVPEHPVQHKLEVKGTLPEGLEGVYVRNGANPMYRPVGGHHLFDGDGMLHAVRISHGVASYANRFTRTHRLKEEERLGRPIFPKAIGELHGHTGIARLLLFYARCLLGLVDGSHGMGVANAGVVFFHGHLLAMSEDDLPYVVHIKRNGDLHTLGKFDFHGQLHNSSMIAHPKVDWKTGELFALSYDVIKKPYLKYFSFKKDGMKACEVSIADVSEPTMVHDFAITKNFVVIPDQQVIFKLPEMLLGHSPVLYTKDKMPRFGILPRNAINDHNMKWINVPECFCFHLWNAWEEGDNVVVIGSCMAPPDSIFNESKGSFQSILTEIRINLTSLTSCQRVISPSLNLEAGQVNRKLLGRKTQYAYLAIAQPWPKVCGVAKVDLLSMKDSIQTNINSLASYLDGEENASLGQLSQLSGGDGGHEGALTNHQLLENNVVASFIYPPNCFGGEPMFIPRSSDPSTPEDDGYVLTYMHNEETCKSELLVLDATSPSLEMIASIKIPSRVPYGFHGTFITMSELEDQKSSII